MDLLAKLQEDMKGAMKSGQKERLAVIRMLISDVKNIDLNPARPTPEQVIAGYAKKLVKAREEFEKIGKTDEVQKLSGELAIVQEYLPKKLSAEETEKLVDAFLAQHAFTQKQMGQAMGQFVKANGGQVDPGIVSQLMKKKLPA